MNIEAIVTTMKTFTTTLALAALLCAAIPAVQAQETHRHQDDAGMAAMSMGEVVRVDQETGKITLRHGPLANLGMPGMTMAFKVAEPAMLTQVQPGDQVRFVAEKANGALTITTLQPAR